MASDSLRTQKCLHPSALSPPSSKHNALARLLRWAAERGAVCPKLALDPADPRRFLAAASITPLEPIITLPQCLLMHAGIALADPVYGPAFRALRAEMAAASATLPVNPLQTACPEPSPGAPVDPDNDHAVSRPGTSTAAATPSVVPYSYWDSGGLSDRDLLCMLLILERARGAASDWAPYIDILPALYDDPAWWGAQSLELLHGTRIARAVAAYRPGLERLAGAMRRLVEIHRQIHIEAPNEEPRLHQAADVARPATTTTVAMTLDENLEAIASSTGFWKQQRPAPSEEGEEEKARMGRLVSERGPSSSAASDPLLSSCWVYSLEAARWARSAVWSRSFTVRGLRSANICGGDDNGRLEGQNGTGQSAEDGSGYVGASMLPAGGGTGPFQPGTGLEGNGTTGQGEVEQRLHVCQVPVLDMIDHAVGCQAVWHTGLQGRGDFVWVRREVVEQGEVLSNNYGSKDNQELLLAYGFVLQPNRHDYVTLTLGCSGDPSTGSGSWDGDNDGVQSGAQGAKPAEGAAELEVAEVQVAAETLQRRMVSAAAGLPVELRLTLEEPLPELLLQAARVAMSSGPRLYFAASEALTSSLQPQMAPDRSQAAGAKLPAAGRTVSRYTVTDGGDGDDDRGGTTTTSTVVVTPPTTLADMPAVFELLQPYDAISELRMLGTVVQQLESRLSVLVSSNREVYDILGLMPPPPPLSPPPPVPEDPSPVVSQPPPPPPPPLPRSISSPSGASTAPGSLRQLLLPKDWLDRLYSHGVNGDPTVGSGPEPDFGHGKHGDLRAPGGVDGGNGVADAAGASSTGCITAAVTTGGAYATAAACSSQADVEDAFSKWLEEAEAEAEAAGVSRHGRMALAVVNCQRAVLTTALWRARQRMAAVIESTSAAAASSPFCSEEVLQAPLTSSCSGSSLELLLPLLPLPHGSEEAVAANNEQDGTESATPATESGNKFGRKGMTLPYRVAARFLRSVPAGGEVLKLPMDECLSAPNAELLVAQLVLGAAALTLPRQPRSPQQQLQPQQQQPQYNPADERTTADGHGGKLRNASGFSEPYSGPDFLLRQLLGYVSPAVPTRLMMAPPPPAGCGLQRGGGRGGGGGGGEREAHGRGLRCLKLLEGTPVGSEYEATAVELQDGFNHFRRRLPSLCPFLPAPLSLSRSGPPQPPPKATSEGAVGDMSAGDGATTTTTAAAAAAAASFLSAPPQSAFWLYCWAREVVERCSVQVDVTEEREKVDEVPGLSDPRTYEQQRQQQQQQQQQRLERRQLHVVLPLLWVLPKELVTTVLRFECSRGQHQLPAPLTLNPELLLVVRTVCPLRRGLVLHPGSLLPDSRDTPSLLTEYGPEALAVVAARQVPGGKAMGDVGPPARVLVTPVHSLELLPGEEDPDRREKMELAGALGLGCEHYLGPGLRGERLLNAALHLMSMPAKEGEKSQSGGSLWVELRRLVGKESKRGHEQQQHHAHGAMVTTSSAASSSHASGIGDGLQLLASTREALSLLLGRIPPGSAAAKGARKLLRRELMDATKHLAAGRRGGEYDAAGNGDLALAGVWRYRQMYGDVLDEWCTWGHLEGRVGVPGAAGRSGGEGTKRCKASFTKDRSRDARGRGGVGGDATAGGDDGGDTGSWVPEEIVEQFLDSGKRHRKA